MIKKMKDIFFTIIIKDTDSLVAIDAIKRQNWNNYECFITNNSLPGLEQYIGLDSHFCIVENKYENKYENINAAIERANGEYFIILNSNDALIPNSLSDISRIANLTDSKIIKYGALYLKKVSEISLDEQQCVFNYLIRRNVIMESVFDNLSAFCFARNIIKKHPLFAPEHIFIMHLLKDIPSIVKTGNTYVLQMVENDKIKSEEYVKIIDSYKDIKNEFSDDFWREYFERIIPELMSAIVSEQRRDIFAYCCKNIPLKFVPLKYKFMFFIIKTLGIS